MKKAKLKSNESPSSPYIQLSSTDIKDDNINSSCKTQNEIELDLQETNPPSVSTNDERDFSETCKEVNEDEMELDLQEPSVVHIIEDNLEDLDREAVIHKVEAYPTAVRRNKERDPNDRARIGFKVDAAIEYQNISWTPVLGCLEVSGGLPRCSRSKEWDTTLKLGLELRDLWAIAEGQLK
ncbi:16732_t:CDS:2, partial [Racocetra fulgida]